MSQEGDQIYPHYKDLLHNLFSIFVSGQSLSLHRNMGFGAAENFKKIIMNKNKKCLFDLFDILRLQIVIKGTNI